MDGELLAGEAMDAKAAALKNPLALAFVGDTVWDLLVRRRLLQTAARVNALHRQATAMVNAGAQAGALTRVEPMLTEDEAAVVRRGTNAHSGHSAPRNQDPVDYSRSTGLEALIGWLYLSGRQARVQAIFEAAWPRAAEEPAAE